MTEKKQQSTVQSEQTQGFNSPAEDELNLKDLLRLLARKKKFILAITSVFTLCSIFYVQSITPLYRATISFLDPKERFSEKIQTINNEELSSFLSTLEQLDPPLLLRVSKEITKPYTIFERFLLNIKSHELKQEVFVNGGFQKKYFGETGIDTDQSVSTIYNSTKVVKHKGITSLRLEGSKPKVMLEFLTAVVEAGKEKTNTQLNDKARSLFKTRMNRLSTQIEDLHQAITLQKEIEKEKRVLQKQIKKEQKAIEIVRLSKALVIAKQMGIKNNNFDKPDKQNAPLWFQYGELALQQKIHWLKSEEEIPNIKNLSIEKLKLKKIQQETMRLRSKQDTPNTKNLKTKKFKLKRLQTANLSPLKFKVVSISEHSYYLVKPNQTFMIVAFGVAFGLFVSIFMAFLIDLKNS